MSRSLQVRVLIARDGDQPLVEDVMDADRGARRQLMVARDGQRKGNVADHDVDAVGTLIGGQRGDERIQDAGVQLVGQHVRARDLDGHPELR
jgi:hypothetical protein